MPIYRKASHVTFDCRYHIVWITKYRKHVLNENIQKRLEVILKWVCKELYVNVISIWMEEDHVHMYVWIPPSKWIPEVLQRLKGRSSHVIQEEYKSYLKEYLWWWNLWWRWYFVVTVWHVDHETIKNYVESQWAAENLWEEVEILWERH